MDRGMPDDTYLFSTYDKAVKRMLDYVQQDSDADLKDIQDTWDLIKATRDAMMCDTKRYTFDFGNDYTGELFEIDVDRHE